MLKVSSRQHSVSQTESYSTYTQHNTHAQHTRTHWLRLYTRDVFAFRRFWPIPPIPHNITIYENDGWSRRRRRIICRRPSAVSGPSSSSSATQRAKQTQALNEPFVRSRNYRTRGRATRAPCMIFVHVLARTNAARAIISSATEYSINRERHISANQTKWGDRVREE